MTRGNEFARRHRPVEGHAVNKVMGLVEPDTTLKQKRFIDIRRGYQRRYQKMQGQVIRDITKRGVVHLHKLATLLGHDYWLTINAKNDWKQRFKFSGVNPEEVLLGYQLLDAATQNPIHFDPAYLSMLDSFLQAALDEFMTQGKIKKREVLVEYPEFGTALKKNQLSSE